MRLYAYYDRFGDERFGVLVDGGRLLTGRQLENVGGLEAVTPAKRRRVAMAARLYAMRRGLSETPLRFDVVAVDGDPEGRPVVHHCLGAFDVTGA